MLLADSIIEAFEKLLEAITPGVPPPPAPAGADAWDPACRPRQENELNTAAAEAAVQTLTKMDSSAAAWWAAGAVRIGLFRQADPVVAGRTKRSTAPGFDFDIELNQNRLVPSYFDMATTLIHELAHVDHVRRVGFLPREVVTEVSQRQYVALVWESELVAFIAMLAGAREIYKVDKDKYRECWHVLVGTDPVLTPLNAGNEALARDAIKGAYPEAEARAYWTNNHAGPAPSQNLLAKWLIFTTFHSLNDLVAAWGL